MAHKSKQEATANGAAASKQPKSFGRVILYLLAVCAAAPFLSLTRGFSGLSQAWKIMGPCQAADGSA